LIVVARREAQHLHSLCCILSKTLP